MSLNPFDIEMQRLAAQEPVVNAMRMQSLSPIENVSAHPGGQISIAQVLAKMLQGHAAGQQSQALAGGRMDLARRMREDTMSGVEEFHNLLQRDPQSAIAFGDAHHSPVVQAIAKRTAKGMLTPKDLAKAATNESLLASQGNPSNFAPKMDLKTVEPGKPFMNQAGQLVRPTGIQPGAQPTLEKIDGNLYQRTDTGLDQINKAPVTSVNTTVNMPGGESEFEKTLGRKEATRLSDAMTLRPGKLEGIDAIGHGMKLLDDGIHTGMFANVAKNVEKGLSAVGGMDPEKAARTEQFIAHIGNIVIPRLKDFGGSDTVEEMKYLQKVMAGDVTMEESSLRRILESAEKNLRRRIHEGDQAIKNYQNRGKSLPTIEPEAIAPVPPTTQPTQANPNQPMELDAYLKMIGVK